MNLNRKKEEPTVTRTVLLEGGPNQRLELELSLSSEGKRELTLRELCWGTGVGWFTHKSIQLDAPQIDNLLKALCCLRQPSGLERCCPLIERTEAPEGTGGKVLKVEFQEPKTPALGS